MTEYQLTKRDFEDARLLLDKLTQTEWEVKDLLLEVIRKYAHMSETARSLQYLPAMKEVEDVVCDIKRESTFAFESEQSSLFIRKDFYERNMGILLKHLYEISKQFRETVTDQCVVEEQ
jgi:hypothetical protein